MSAPERLVNLKDWCLLTLKELSKKLFLIEFEPLSQKLWAFLSNFGYSTMPAQQIWSCHVTQNVNFEIFLFCPNSTFNIRKSHKISSGKALYFRSYQQKPHSPHSAFTVKFFT